MKEWASLLVWTLVGLSRQWVVSQWPWLSLNCKLAASIQYPAGGTAYVWCGYLADHNQLDPTKKYFFHWKPLTWFPKQLIAVMLMMMVMMIWVRMMMILLRVVIFKAPTHSPDVQLPYPTTLRPLCCLLSDPFGTKVTLNTPLRRAAFSTVACTSEMQ